MIDMLFECALQPRTPWYPESQAQSTAAECLAAMFQSPLNAVPGPASAADKELTAEVNDMREALRLLVSRENWWSKIIAVWNKPDEESAQTVVRCVQSSEYVRYS